MSQLVTGFTGTRYGLTEAQLAALVKMIDLSDVVKHGDCIGGDAQAHQLAIDLGKAVEIHPPDNPKLRANCKGARKVFPEKPYRQRNRDIVNACKVLVAAPKTRTVQPYSGTWSTVNYAISIERPVRVIYPDGEVERM